MNINTGEIGEYLRLVAEAKDSGDVVPIPNELELEAKEILRRGTPFVDLKGDSSLSQFAKEHQHRKKKEKAKARRHRKEAKRHKARMRR